VRTVHHLDHFDNPRLAAWQRRAYEDADRVLCVSGAWSRIMLEKYGVRAATVSNGVDVCRFSTTQDRHDAQLAHCYGMGDGPVVLAVGGIEERKNTLALVESFARVLPRLPDAQLVIAGGASLLDHDAYARRVLQRAAELGLSIGPGERVVVTGPVADDVMPALFRRANVLAMVSLREGFGLVVLEALASGTPVVASKIEPFTGYLDERTCTWADPLDVDSIGQALLDVLTAENGENNTDFTHAVPELLKRFSWHASAQLHVDAYRAYLREREPRAFAIN
jgi:glycosyltransferase-like protein